MRILLVEDDETLASAVREQIAADGHAVDYARRLNDANDDVRAVAYDLILLDLMLPDGRGLDFLRQLRKAGDATPVIILTARDQISDRIAGLNAGADDYLVKPFDLFELSARVAAVSRRYSGNPNPLLNLGKLEIDLAGRSVRREGRPVTLTAREWAPVRGTHSASGLDPVKIATGRPSLLVRFRNREQHDRSPCKPPAQEARAGRDRNAARHRLPGENMMDRTASLQRRLSIGLAVGITAIWLAGTLAAGIIIRHELDEAFDSALQETAQRLLPLAVLDIVDRDTATPRAHRVAAIGEDEEYLTYLVRDGAGNILLQSHDADPGVFPGEPAHGFRDTLTHRLYGEAAVSSTVFIEIAEPLAHRRMAAFEATIGLFAPLPILIPLSLLAVWWFVRRSMKPILAFRTEIEIRGEGNLSPLSGAELPAEIAPVAEAVSRLMKRLRRALEAERGFAANSAHELRTPIAAALAQTQRLIAQAPEGAVRDRARQIEMSLRQLAHLSEKLLQLARAEGGSLVSETPQDLLPVLLHIADEFRQSPEIGNRLVLDWDEQSAQNSQIDADAFAILMRNLIENALEHGQSGGTVIIAVTGEGSTRVINEGNAVPPETLPQLKERFARAGRSDKGAGLGLAIADMIATGAGGGLDLISPATGSEEGFEAVFYPPKPRSTQPSSERQS